MTRQIKVIASTIISADTYTGLTKLQSLICKWFKITPERYIDYKLDIEYDNPLNYSYFIVGTIIIDNWATEYIVTQLFGYNRIRVMIYSRNTIKSINKPDYISIQFQT